MEKINLLIIVPYEGLKSVILDVAEEYSEFNVDIVVGNLESGMQAFIEAADKDFDIIMSRGGTTNMIEKIAYCPVINIDISGYDFLRTIALSDNFLCKSAVVGFANITSGALATKGLIKSDINVFTINNEQELDALLEQLRKQDYQVIVGDVVTVKYAKREGFNGILLTSGVESVRNAFVEAKKVCAYIYKYKMRSRLFKQMVTEFPQYSILFLEDGKIVYENLPLQEKLFFQEELPKYIQDVIHSGNQHLLFDLPECIWSVTGKLIKSDEFQFYVAYYIQKGAEKKHKTNGITIKNFEYHPHNQMKILGAYNVYFKGIIKEVCEYNKYQEPILIFGKAGTGKDMLALMVHLLYENKQCTMITIDCEVVTQDDLILLSQNLDEFFVPGKTATLYLREVTTLNIESQKTLYSILCTEGFLSNCRIVSSVDESLDAMMACGEFLESLGCLLGERRIYIPSLEERTEEIKTLISYCINEANEKYGKQVIGIDDQSQELLKSFHWDTNVEQLYRIINQLVLFSDGAYITSQQTDKILKEEKSTIVCKNVLQWSQGKTLDEITMDVIYAVMEQEKGNLTKVANQLGISRTTLWRKINEAAKLK